MQGSIVFLIHLDVQHTLLTNMVQWESQFEYMLAQVTNGSFWFSNRAVWSEFCLRATWSYYLELPWYCGRLHTETLIDNQYNMYPLQ